MAFVQIIEITTSRLSEYEAVIDNWLANTEGRRRAQRSLLTKDRDRADTYIQVVEFPSYEDAMANSNLPETSAFADELTKLCDTPPSFRNLDIVREDHM